MTMRLIMNPGSRSGRGQRRWPQWQDLLRKAGMAIDPRITESMAHARDLADDAAADTVVAVGGDGTINAVLDGLLQSERPDRPMGILYAGTSPDFCRFHGIPTDPLDALHTLLHGRTRRVDAARITWTDAAGRTACGHFGCSANIGLGAAIARRANGLRRLLGDAPGTGLAALSAVLRAAPLPLRVQVDGGTPREVPRMNHLAILKNPALASGLKLSLPLQPDDGTLIVVALAGLSPFALLRLLPGFYTGRAVAHPALSQQRAHRVRVDGPPGTEVEFDGDPHGFLPVTVEILPRALTLLGGP